MSSTEEANNTVLVGRMFADHPDLLVPKVIHPYVTEEVLVLEHIDGERVGPDHGLDDERAAHLAREFFRAYVRQVAAEGLYHADPHRGNVLVTPDGRLALLDFGLLGRLDDDTRVSIAQLLLAIAQNRGDDVSALILSLSHTTLDSDEPAFVAELWRKLPRYHHRPLSGIRTGDALADLQRMTVAYSIRLPTSFALVGKTLSQADSIARTLDPTMDPIELLRGDALELMLREGERRLEPTELASYAFTQLAPLARLPRRIGQVTDRLEEGTLRIGITPANLGELEAVMRSAANRIGAAIIVAGLLLATAWMARVNEALSIVGFVVASALGLCMLWKFCGLLGLCRRGGLVVEVRFGNKAPPLPRNNARRPLGRRRHSRPARVGAPISWNRPRGFRVDRGKHGRHHSRGTEGSPWKPPRSN